MNITVAGTVNVDVMRVARHEIEHLCEAGDQEQLWFGLGAVFLTFTAFFLSPLVTPGELNAFWGALCHLGALTFGLLALISAYVWRTQRKKRLKRRNTMFGL